MSKSRIPTDESVSANMPVGSLDDEEDFHVVPRKRLLWPSLVHTNSDVHHMTTSFHGRVWLEIGFSAWSLMPFARNATLHMAFDERAWVKKMMDNSHLPKVIESYLCVDARFPETPAAPIMQALAERCDSLVKPEQIGVAFFIMSRLRGVSRIYSTLERSVDCSAIHGERAIVLARPYSLAPVNLKPDGMSNLALLQEIGQQVADESERFHLNINRSMGDETANIAKSMTRLGFSWSMAIPSEQRSIARSLSSVVGATVTKVGQCYYATKEPS